MRSLPWLSLAACPARFPRNPEPRLVLRALKQLTLWGCRAAGVTRIVAGSNWRRQRLLVLCHHGVALEDEHEWDPQLYVSADHLEARLRFLQEHDYHVLPLGSALDALAIGRLPSRAVVLTFDDGHYDFYVRAYPLLQALELPVTVYLTTYYSGYQRPVFDMVASYILWKGRGRVVDVADLLEGWGKLDLRDDAERIERHQQLRAHVRRIGASAEEKDALARALAERLDVDYDHILARRVLHLMNPDEVRTIAASGVDIELHTHRHRVPSDREAFSREIEDNRENIRRFTGGSPRHFCYPSGEYASEFLPWLRELGVRSAVTCAPGLAARSDDPLLLPRILDNAGMPLVEFEGWTSGLLQLLKVR